MINIHKVVLKECPLDTPFAPKEKSAITSAIIAGAAAVAGATISAASQSSTNAQNKEMNNENIEMQRETNSMQERLYNTSLASQYDMWNKQNEYNLPKNQVSRLIEAGINPLAALGGVSQGQVAGSMNAPSAPQMTAPRNVFEMSSTDFSGITNAGIAAINAYNSSRLMQAETKNKEALTGNTLFDTSNKKALAASQLEFLQKQAKREGYLGDIARQQLSLIKATQQYEIDLKFGDLASQKKSQQLMDAQLRNANLNADILEIQKGYTKQLSQAQIAQMWSAVHRANAEIGLINANEMLTNEQRLHEIEKRVGTALDNGMKGIDYDIKRTVKETLIKNEFNKGEMLDFERRNQKSGEMLRRLSSVIPFTSASSKVLF